MAIDASQVRLREVSLFLALTIVKGEEERKGEEEGRRKRGGRASRAREGETSLLTLRFAIDDTTLRIYYIIHGDLILFLSLSCFDSRLPVGIGYLDIFHLI